MSPVIRAILTADPNLPADEVIKKVRAKGVTAPDPAIRHNIYNIRSELKKKAAKPSPASSRQSSAPKPVVAAKPATTAPKPSTSAKLTAPVRNPSASGKLATSSGAPASLGRVLANVARVDAVVGACGGVEHARQTAEAVRECGGVEAFLKHLDLVESIKADRSST
jgi:hypothetical protein